MSRNMNEEEMVELRNWLHDLDIIPNGKIHREFSDAVLVAFLLKKFYPKLIDLHNYPAHNSTKRKLSNWETLNLKVLSKLGLQQNKLTLEKLAKGVPGAIDNLLCDIMQHEKANRIKAKAEDEQELIWSENDEVMTVTVNKKIGDAIVQVPQKMILFSTYEKVVRESQAKDTYLSAAQQRISHLDNLLDLKGERIDELCNQLAKVTVRNLLSQHCLHKDLAHNERTDDAGDEIDSVETQ